MGGREIELKLKIEEKDYIRLLKELENTAISKSPKHQVDIYYSPEGKSFYNCGDRCLRVRIQDGDIILSYKRIYNEDTSEQFIEEYETHVDSHEVVDHILEALGYRKEIVVNKYRVEYCTKDCHLISLDKVENLGFFIEIENLNDSDSLQKQNQELVAIAERYGLDMNNRNVEGYSNMLFKKKNSNGDEE